jgi:hypothetical protein
MSYIELKTNIKITEEREKILREELGHAIETIPGKTEACLMLGFMDEVKMAFRGETDPLAMIEVDLYGKADPTYYDIFTRRVCDITSATLSIPGERIYVKYSEVKHWGYDGDNF